MLQMFSVGCTRFSGPTLVFRVQRKTAARRAFRQWHRASASRPAPSPDAVVPSFLRRATATDVHCPRHQVPVRRVHINQLVRGNLVEIASGQPGASGLRTDRTPQIIPATCARAICAGPRVRSCSPCAQGSNNAAVARDPCCDTVVLSRLMRGGKRGEMG